MLNEIGDVSQIDKYLAKAKDKDDPFRLMGFGHRVYKKYDPRAGIIREVCHEVLAVITSYSIHYTKLYESAIESSTASGRISDARSWVLNLPVRTRMALPTSYNFV